MPEYSPASLQTPDCMRTEYLRILVAEDQEAQRLLLVQNPVTPETVAVLLRLDPTSRTVITPQARQAFSAAEVSAALTNKEFRPFFQPKIDVGTGSVVGIEALARWHHPVYGIVSPDS